MNLSKNKLFWGLLVFNSILVVQGFFSNHPMTTSEIVSLGVEYGKFLFSIVFFGVLGVVVGKGSESAKKDLFKSSSVSFLSLLGAVNFFGVVLYLLPPSFVSLSSFFLFFWYFFIPFVAFALSSYIYFEFMGEETGLGNFKLLVAWFFSLLIVYGGSFLLGGLI